MPKDKKNENISNFEEIWLEAILTQGVLTNAEIILILKHFGLGSFEEYSDDESGLKDMMYVAISKIPRGELIKEVELILNETETKRMSINEAGGVYKFLVQESKESLVDFYNNILHKNDLKNNADSYDITMLILGELYKLPKNDSIQLVELNFKK